MPERPGPIGIDIVNSDDPWAPGSGARFERVEPATFERAEEAPARPDEFEPAASGRRRLRSAVVAGVAVAGLIGAVALYGVDSAVGDPATAVSTDPVPASLPEPERTLDDLGRAQMVDSDGDVDGDVVLGPGDVPLSTGSSRCLPGRLPTERQPRWAVDVTPTSGVVTGALAVGGDLGFVTTHDPGVASGSVTELIAVDLADGVEAWRTSFPDATSGVVDVEAVVGDIALVTHHIRDSGDPEDPGSTVAAGISIVTGVERWRRVVAQPNLVVTAPDAVSLLEVDAGGVGSGPPSVSVIDMESGDQVAEQPGRFVDAFVGGRPVTLDGADLVVGDVRFATDGIAPGQLVEVAGGLVARGGGGELVGYAAAGDGWSDAQELRLTGSAGISLPDTIDRVSPIVGTSILVEADGAVHGANVALDSVELRWTRAGEIVDSAQSDRGRLLVIRRLDGSEIVVDSSTGRTVAQIPAINARLHGLHADGVTIARFDEVTSARSIVAIGLDGEVRWNLPGTVSLAAGDRVVVAMGPASSTGAVTLSAYGDADASPARCGTVLREWVTS